LLSTNVSTVELSLHHTSEFNLTLQPIFSSDYSFGYVVLICVEKLTLSKFLPNPSFVGATMTLYGTGFAADTDAEICLSRHHCFPVICESGEICKFEMSLPPSDSPHIMLRFPRLSLSSNSLPFVLLNSQSITLVPSIGFSHGGDTLTVVGKLFSRFWSYHCQFFDDAPTVAALQISEKSLTCKVPTYLPTNTSVVIHPGGFSALFQYLDAIPSRLLPTEGPTFGGNQVILEFSGKIGIYTSALLRVIGGHSFGRCEPFFNGLTDSLRCLIPASNAGQVFFEVSFDGGAGFLKIPLLFLYFSSLTLTSVYPTRIASSASAIVTVTGAFSRSSSLKCYFGKPNISSVATVISDNQALCTVPDSVVEGFSDISLVNEQRNQSSSSFPVMFTPAATVVAIEPTAIVSGQFVTIIGFNFDANIQQKCTFGDDSSSAIVLSSSKIICFAPSNLWGNISISVDHSTSFLISSVTSSVASILPNGTSCTPIFLKINLRSEDNDNSGILTGSGFDCLEIQSVRVGRTVCLVHRSTSTKVFFFCSDIFVKGSVTLWLRSQVSINTNLSVSSLTIKSISPTFGFVASAASVSVYGSGFEDFVSSFCEIGEQVIPFTVYHQVSENDPSGHCSLIDVNLLPANYSLKVCSSSTCSNSVGFALFSRIFNTIKLIDNFVISGLPMLLRISSVGFEHFLNELSCVWKFSVQNMSSFTSLVSFADQKYAESAFCEVPNFTPQSTYFEVRLKDGSLIQSFNVTVQQALKVAFSVPEFASSYGVTVLILRLSSHTWSLQLLRSVRILDQHNQVLRSNVIDIQNVQVFVEGKGSPSCTLTLHLPGVGSPICSFIIMNVPVPAVNNATSVTMNGQLYSSVEGENFWRSSQLVCKFGYDTVVSAQFISSVRVLCPISSDILGNVSVSVSNNKATFSRVTWIAFIL